MSIRLRLAAAALLIAAPSLAAPAKKAPTPTPPAKAGAAQGMIDKSAMDALDRSRAYLRTLRGFELRAEMTIDEVEEGDLSSSSSVARDMISQRPTGCSSSGNRTASFASSISTARLPPCWRRGSATMPRCSVPAPSRTS